jgi:hypothetical protein
MNLKDIIQEKIPFGKTASIKRGLKSKHGKSTLDGGTFGVEFEFSSKNDIDLVALLFNNKDIVAKYLKNNLPGSFEYDYDNFVEQKRFELNRNNSVNDWDDSYGPIDVVTWTEENPKPEREDYDSKEEYKIDLEKWDVKRDEVEEIYNKWEHFEKNNNMDDFCENVFTNNQLDRYLDSDDIDNLFGDYNNVEEIISSVTNFLEDLGESVGDDPDETTWAVFPEHDNMVEVASRHLTKKDFPLLVKLMKFIHDNFKVHGGSSAHVHVGVPDLNWFDSLVMATLVDEDKIKKDISPDRKSTSWANLNDVLHLKLYHILKNHFKQSTFVSEIELLQIVKDIGKYFGTNTTAFVKQGTIEFRYFSSQIISKPKKFLKWIEYFLVLPHVAKRRKDVVFGEKGNVVKLKRIPGGKIEIIFDDDKSSSKLPSGISPDDMKDREHTGVEGLKYFKNDDRKTLVKALKGMPLNKRNKFLAMIKNPNMDSHKKLRSLIDKFDDSNKKSINEDYPKSFSMEEFNNIPSYRGKVKYANDRLKKLGAGSSRVVFQIDNNKVLKLAKNGKGLAQNEVETDGYFGQMDITANIIDYDDKHDMPYWVEMELAIPINRNKKKLEHLLGLSLEELESFLIANNPNSRGPSYRSYKISQERMDELWEHEYASQLVDLVGNIDMEVGDLVRPSSWGIVNRGGKDEPVLIDFGFTNNVRANYYAR